MTRAQILLRAILELQPRLHQEQAMTIASAIASESRGRNLDDLTLVALAMAESSLLPTRVNPKTHASGLFQLMPLHWDDWEDPNTVLLVVPNTAIAAQLFAHYLWKCGGDTALAVGRWNGLGCKKTKFSDKVMKIRDRLRKYERVTT